MNLYPKCVFLRYRAKKIQQICFTIGFDGGLIPKFNFSLEITSFIHRENELTSNTPSGDIS